MTDLAAAGYFSNSSRVNSEAKQGHDDTLNVIRELIGGKGAKELTIASADITPADGDGAFITVDTESDAAADDLEHIIQTNTRDGQLIVLSSVDQSRVVTLKDNQGGAGELLLANGDIVLNKTNIRVWLRRVGTAWQEEFRTYSSNFDDWATFYNVGRLSNVNAYSAMQYYTAQELTDDTTIDWNLRAMPVAKVTAGGDRTFNLPTNITEDTIVLLKHIQDATGGRNPTWNAAFDFTRLTGGEAPNLSARTNGQEDLFVFICNSTDSKLECIKHIQRG